jgi:polyisoprenoid-binding protein YceI
MKMAAAVPCLLICLAAPALNAAGLTTVEFDSGRTQVHYTVASTLHTVHGTFRLKRGLVRFDPATGKAEGELVVDAASGDSGTAARDRRMSESILETAKFPDIVFTPEQVEGTVNPAGPSRINVRGQFRIHGASHLLTLAIETRSTPDRITVSTHFTVPYIQWGMKNPSTFILRVNDKVEIAIDAEAKISAE